MPDPREHDTNEPDPVRGQTPKVEPNSPTDSPPKIDPATGHDPEDEQVPGDPPDDLDDGPLVAMNANQPSQG